MIELKPCPFCGCTNIGAYENYSMCAIEVVCQECNAIARSYSNLDDAIRRWNRREGKE